jgi:signal transduction histidine kinase
MALILNVDSDASVRSATKVLLETAGFAVEEFAKGADAVEFATHNRVDVVILHLPLSEGARVCRQLKDQPHPFAPVTVLRIPAEDWRARSWPVGGFIADALLPEDAGEAALLETVRSMVRLRSAQLEARDALGEADALRQELRRSQDDLEKLGRRLRHDLEAPLRAMNTFVELVAAARTGQLTDDEQTYLKAVLSGTGRARLVLDGLVLFAQAGKQNPQSWRLIQLKGVVAAALQQLAGPIQKAGATIHLEETTAQIRGSFAGLQQVIQGLVSNAIQYRREPIGVHISIQAKRQSEDEWVVSVSDDGMGIDSSHHQSIFAPLQRLHGNEIEGSGMGLAICKRIVEAHGGRIWVESEPGSGATFLFTLPAAASEGQQVLAAG